MIHSHTNDAMKNFSSQIVLNHVLREKKTKKKNPTENNQMLSNSSVYLEAIQREHAHFGGKSVSDDA